MFPTYRGAKTHSLEDHLLVNIVRLEDAEAAIMKRENHRTRIGMPVPGQTLHPSGPTEYLLPYLSELE